MNPNPSSSSGQSVASQPLSTDWCSNFEELPEMFQAVIKRDVEKVRRLINEGQYSNGQCTLEIPSNLSIAITLSPLALAIELGFPELVELLKEEVAFDEKVRLHIGGRTAAVPVLYQCIQAIRFPSVASMKDNFYAAKRDRLVERMHIFKCLVEGPKRREEGEAFKKIRDEALHYAVLCGSCGLVSEKAEVKKAIEEVIKELLEQGARLPKEVPYFAEVKQYTQSMYGKTFEKHSKEKNTVLHIGIIERSDELLAILLDSLADADQELVNAKNKFGKTPLQLAVEEKQFKNAGLLIEKRANINIDVLRNYLQKQSSAYLERIKDLSKICENIVEKYSSPVPEDVKKIQAFLASCREAAELFYKNAVRRRHDETTPVNFDEQLHSGDEYTPHINIAYFRTLFAVDLPITALDTLCKTLESIPGHEQVLSKCKNNLKFWKDLQNIQKKKELDYLDKIIKQIYP